MPNPLLAKSVHVINPSLPNPLLVPADGETSEAYAWGLVPVNADAPECIAKKVVHMGKATCFIKRATVGPDAGKLFNPSSPNHPVETNMTKVLGQNGKFMFEFRKSNERAYAFYLDFMRTGNIVHLRHAERELG